ncbi:MAG: glycoside hydrolase family 97 protein [Paraprevotella sp.]|nr:glycoside hydrolase family 97 protein [Paraprevotella sp.]
MKKFFFAAFWMAGMMMTPVAAEVLESYGAAQAIATADTIGRQQEKTVVSPDGMTFLKVGLKDGRPYYKAGYYTREKKEVLMVDESPLGLRADIGDFTQGLTWVEDHGGTHDISYDLGRSKTSRVDRKANDFSVRLSNAEKAEIDMEFVVEDHNIAFRYHLPKPKEAGCVRVMAESTGFRFPEKTTTFLAPQSDAMIGWKRTKPSYEEEYKADAPMDTPSQYGHGYTFPGLSHVGDDGWVLVSETGVDSRYCASRLSYAHDRLYTVAFPMPEDNNGNGTSEPAFALPGATPWRTLTLAPTLGPIVETTIPWAVVEPRFATEHKYKTGRGTWSWILWQDGSIHYDDQVRYVDWAASMGYEYTLVDNWWNRNIGHERMADLIRYARSKGVELFLWYSSSGYWNDIDQGPINIMDNPITRKREMKWLQQQGVKGIKVDFFGGDKQETMRLYEAILSDADDYGLMVILHGCTIPRGWERMYPNYVGSEAVLASENLIFNQHFCDNEAFNATLHPFIRNAVGSMEFGGTFLNKRLNRGNDGGTTRVTTDVFELATAVAFQNSVQNFALAPNNLTDQPDFVLDFMKGVPTTLDETRFIDGYPGRYVVLARRHGQDCYVAALNAEKETLQLTVDLPLAAGSRVTYYHDGKDGKTPVQEEAQVDKKGRFKFVLPPNGGSVLKGK